MKKLKQKLLLFALLGASLSGLVLSVVSPVLADSFGAQVLRVLGFLPKILFDIVMNILNFFFGIIAVIITFFGQITLNIALNSDPNFVLNSPVTGTVWEKMLTLTNGIYLLILVAASIAIILRVNVGVYNVKKILGGLVAAIALSNLSLLIVRVLVEFSASITTGLTALFGFSQSYKSFLLALLWETQPITYYGVVGDAASGMEIIIAWIIFFLVATLVIKIAIVLLERMIWVFALAIIAPLAFAVGVLPNMQSYTKQWWETLIKWVMVLPATIGITCLAIYVMTNGNSNSATTISQQVKALSGLFRVNDANLITIDPPLIMMIAGLAILWFAGEVGKKMKISTATGTAFKSASKTIGDTLAGKNAVGKFAKDKYDEDIYPELMKSKKSIGGKTFAEWEGQRQTWTKGWKARVFNPKGRAAAAKADAKKTRLESAAKAQATKVADLGNAMKAKYANDLDENDNLKDTASDTVKENYAKDLSELKGEQSALRKYHVKNLNEDFKPSNLPTYEELKEKYEKAMNRKDSNGNSNIDYGEANGALDLMQQLSRAGNIRKGEADQAKDFFRDQSNLDDIKNKLHLNPKEFIPHISQQDQLKRAKADAPADIDELLAKTEGSISRIETEIKDTVENRSRVIADLQSKYGIDVTNTNRMNIMKNINTKMGASNNKYKGISATQKKTVLETVLKARGGDYQMSDAKDFDAVLRRLQRTDEFKNSSSDTQAYYFRTLQDLVDTNADNEDIENYIKIEDAASTNNATATQIIQQAETAPAIETQKITILNKQLEELNNDKADLTKTIKIDNTSHRGNYEMMIRNNITSRMKNNKVDSLTAKKELGNDLDKIKKDITTAFQQKGNISHNEPLKQVIGIPEFVNIIDKYKALGLSNISDQELEKKTIGEFAADIRRAEDALKNMNQPAKTKKEGGKKTT